MRILALDFETGGTDANRNAPVSLGVAVMEYNGGNVEVIASTEWIIGPTLHWKTGKVEREYTVNALEISTIKWPEIKRAPLPKQIVKELSAWVALQRAEELPVVAYRASFDHAFFDTLLFLASDWHPREKGKKIIPVTPIHGGWHCAYHAFKAAFPNESDHTLDTAAARFGMQRSSEAHGALEDAIIAGKVWFALKTAETGEQAARTTDSDGGWSE